MDELLSMYDDGRRARAAGEEGLEEEEEEFEEEGDEEAAEQRHIARVRAGRGRRRGRAGGWPACVWHTGSALAQHGRR